MKDGGLASSGPEGCQEGSPATFSFDGTSCQIGDDLPTLTARRAKFSVQRQFGGSIGAIEDGSHSDNTLEPLSDIVGSCTCGWRLPHILATL